MNQNLPLKSVSSVSAHDDISQPMPAPQPSPTFARDNWHGELLALNPWATVFLKDGLRIATEEFHQASQLASQARWLAGRQVWNGWANSMVALKSNLEGSQLWYVNTLGEGANEETKTWLALAEGIFSSLTLIRGNDGYIDFEQFIFPSHTWFVDASFTGESRFAGAKFLGNAYFNRSKFIGKANFCDTIFNGHAHFREARFTGNSRFQNCTFHGDAILDRTTFTGGTTFSQSKFGGVTDFTQANFVGDATYEQVEFTGDATFSDSRFAGTAWFPKCSFIGNTTFSKSLMIGDAWFSETNFIGNVLFDETKFPCNSRFENAQFCGLSSFKNAEFSDNTQFNSARFIGETELAADSLPDTAEINTITITGPMRKEREKIELDEMFPSLARNASTSLEGTDFKSVPDFQGVTMDEPPSVSDMSVADPIKTQHDWDGSKKKSRDQTD